jgi:putative transcriptional regulator
MSEDSSERRELAGNFLMAETDLEDPNFFRTVVLIVHHNDEGAFGLVVNRRSEVTIGEVLEGIENTPMADMPVFVGGPVQQNYLFVLHSGLPVGFSSDHIIEPGPGIFFEPSFQHVADFVSSPTYWDLPEANRPSIHVFAGYSGWGPGQLEAELEESAWLVHPAQKDIVFHPHPEKGWRDAVSKKGSFYRIVAETGFRPSLN